MIIIAVFLPSVFAFVLWLIWDNKYTEFHPAKWILRYCSYAFIVNLVVWFTITYVIGINGVKIVALKSLRFFCIYMGMACICAGYLVVMEKMIRKNKEKKKIIKEDRIHLSIVSAFLSFTFIVYGPLEIYLTNINEFWFSLSQFWFIPIILGVAVTCMLFIIGIQMPKWILNMYTGMLFGISVLVYVQSNFLNMNIGVMNGAEHEWETFHIRFLINFVIWVVVISTMLCLYCDKYTKLKKAVKYISIGLVLVQLITLITLMVTIKSDIDKGGITHFISDKNIYEVSSDENIVVFILDMFDDQYFKKLIEEDSSFVNQFNGFTQYVNSTGNYSTTQYSIGTLLTGQYLKNSAPSYYEEITSLYKKCDMYDKLLEQNYRLDIYTYDEMVPENLKEKTSNYIEGYKQISDYWDFTKDVYRLTSCKYLPDFIKQHMWMTGTEFNDLIKVDGVMPHSVDNIHFYDGLLKDGITTQNDKKCFKFIHIDATHYPYTMNENVERVEESKTSDLQCAKGVIKIVQKYIEGMKDAGVYDTSSIIIMADHGYYWDGTLCNPVLLVKPKNASGEMKVSNAPVSHHDFQPTILEMAGLDKEKPEDKSFMELQDTDKRERLFYQYYLQEKHDGGRFRLIEYSIDSESNERKSFHLTGNEYTIEGEVINHFEYCKYCQEGNIEPNDNKIRVVHQ